MVSTLERRVARLEEVKGVPGLLSHDEAVLIMWRLDHPPAGYTEEDAQRDRDRLAWDNEVMLQKRPELVALLLGQPMLEVDEHDQEGRDVEGDGA